MEGDTAEGVKCYLKFFTREYSPVNCSNIFKNLKIEVSSCSIEVKKSLLRKTYPVWRT